MFWFVLVGLISAAVVYQVITCIVPIPAFDALIYVWEALPYLVCAQMLIDLVQLYILYAGPMWG